MSGLCGQPFGHFLLNHHGDIYDAVAIFDEAFEQRRCNVVRKIADKMKWSGREVHLQGVAFDDVDVGRHLGTKAGIRSLSISMAMTRAATAASSRVSAPAPGPISTTVSRA